MNKILLKQQLTPFEADYARWCAEQGALLREGRLSDLDRDNLAEEIESLGRSADGKSRAGSRSCSCICSNGTSSRSSGLAAGNRRSLNNGRELPGSSRKVRACAPIRSKRWRTNTRSLAWRRPVKLVWMKRSFRRIAPFPSSRFLMHSFSPSDVGAC